MTTSTPTSPAGPSLRIDPPPPEPPPPRPGLASIPGILVAGLPTMLFAALMAGALAMPFVGDFRPPVKMLEVVIFTVIPGAGLLVFVRAWWQSIRRLGREAPSWAALMVPFFIVVGAALGVAFISAAYAARDAEGGFVAIFCSDVEETDTVACEARVASCVRELIAADRDTDDEMKACMTSATPR